MADAGLADRILILEGDAARANLDTATIIFMFLPPEVVGPLLPDILARRPEGCVVVAHEQLAVEWPVEPDERHLVLDGGVTVAYIWR